MDTQIEPKEALTGFLDLPGIGRIRLDFLITYGYCWRIQKVAQDSFLVSGKEANLKSWATNKKQLIPSSPTVSLMNQTPIIFDALILA